MNPFSVDLKDLFVIGGVGVFKSITLNTWGIFIGEEPPVPPAQPTVVTIYDTGGPAPFPGRNISMEEPRAQIRVRGAVGGYLAAYAKSRQCRDLLWGHDIFSVGSVNYSGLWIQTEPMFLGPDDKNQPIFSFNVRAVRGEAVAAA